MRAFFGALLLCSLAVAGEYREPKTIQTNSVNVHNAPSWVTESRVNTVARRIENLLEWDIRRVNVYWHTDPKEFEAVHKLGPKVMASTNKATSTVHIGPKVNQENFDGIFGHELTHVIVLQKYKGAIPQWLEEGLANHMGRIGKVDYKFLSEQPQVDVTSLSHPFKDAIGVGYHYQASTAMMEMIASRCNLHDLLQLSVGKKMEIYLKNYCEIQDLNQAFRDWISKNAKLSFQKTDK